MRKLTEKQQLFLEVLFEEAKGDATQARKLAGYSETVSTSSVVNSLQDEILERTKKFISTTATKAAFSMRQIMDSPTDLGNKEKMAAAKDILDRGGFKPSDKVEVAANSPLFILPPKNE